MRAQRTAHTISTANRRSHDRSSTCADRRVRRSPTWAARALQFHVEMQRRVLIADDDVDLLEAIVHVIEHRGWISVKARDGLELMEALAHGHFDLVITDISMPSMTGVQASHSARYAGLDTPILVITALEDPTLDERVASLGSHARLLRKPFSLAALEENIDVLLGVAHAPDPPQP